MLDNIIYWLKGEPVQNFGDFLAEFFLERLFVREAVPAAAIHLIGSAPADFYVSPHTRAGGIPAKGPVIFWGCGLRDSEGLPAEWRQGSEVLAVRGPLTRSALGLGDAVPIGDPGLLLPFLHRPAALGGGGAVLVPHFHEQRSDDALMAQSGCDRVLRPNLANNTGAIVDFLEVLLAADFTLCGSLHAAIVRAAYGRPFAYWDSGVVDLPFEWEDFSASVGIACAFHATPDAGRAFWESHIRTQLRLPVLWPLLAVAPLPVRPDIFVRTIARDIERLGLSVLAAHAPISVPSRLGTIREKSFHTITDRADALDGRTAERAAAEKLIAMAAERNRLAAELKAVRIERERLSADLAAALSDKEAWQDRAEASMAEALCLQTSLARQTQEVVRVRRQIAAIQSAADAQRQRLVSIEQSTIWKWTRPIRQFGRKHPELARWARLAVKGAWWTASLRLPSRVRADRSNRADSERIPSTAAPVVLPAVKPQAEFDLGLQIPDSTRAEPIDGPGVESPAPSNTKFDIRAQFLQAKGAEPIDFPRVESPIVSVIIPAYRGLADIETCLQSLAAFREGEPAFEVVLVDDCPTDPILSAIPDSPGLVKIANEINLGFLLTCNRGAGVARGRYLCFLNTDTIVTPKWLSTLVEAARDTPNAALVGCMLLNRDGTIQDAGWHILGNGWGHPLGRNCEARDGSHTYRRAVDCVTGACFLMPADKFRALGGLDPDYAPAFYEEFDLAFRARERGWTVIYEPRSQVVHLGSMSYGAARRDQLTSINHVKFCNRFAAVLRKRGWDASDEFPLRHAFDTGPVLLVVDYGVPHPDRQAGDVTISRYLSLLAAAGWRVVFGPRDGKADGPAAEALERQGIELIRGPRTIEDWLADHGQHVRAVWIARPEIAEKLVRTVRVLSDAPIAYYTHDLHHVRLRREAELRGDSALRQEADRVLAMETRVFESVDCVTSPSQVECNIVRGLNPDVPTVPLPPYFYEAEEIRVRDAAHFATCHDVVFVGGYPHTPNVDAALFIANEVMPLVWRERPDARLVLVGYAPPPQVLALAGEKVTVTGQVPAVEPYLDAARVNLAALRYGAGVKGKVVQALQLGVPVVTTEIGAEGIGITPGQDAIVADGAAALAQAVVSLFRDPARCAELSAAGAALVGKRFTRAAARTAIGRVFDQPRCAVCGSARLLTPAESANPREAFVCANCFALGRTEALSRIVLRRVARNGEGSLAELARGRPDIRIHEFGFVGGIAETLRGWENYSVSEYFEGVPPGAAGPYGVRCEDMQNLTFANESFDLILCQDVLEHLPNPAHAFAEAFRVLRTGGALIFTVPQNRNMPSSITRARIGAKGIEYILPPEYHGDPVRPEGALVFTDYGMDLAAMVERTGLRIVESEIDVAGGGVNGAVWIFEAVKPSVQAISDAKSSEAAAPRRMLVARAN